MEENNKKSRLWTPQLPIRKVLDWGRYDDAADLERDDDEDPGQFTAHHPETHSLTLSYRRHSWHTG